MTTILPVASEHSSIHDLVSTQPLPAVTLPRTAEPARRQAIGRLLPMLLMAFALLNFADLGSTYLGLIHGLNEGNPLMGGLLLHFGFGALILYKLLAIAAVSKGAVLLYNMRHRTACVTIIACDALVLVVVIANLAQYALIR